MIGHCSAFLTSQSTRHVLQALVVTPGLLPRCVVMCGKGGHTVGKLQLVQKKAARISLTYIYMVDKCQQHAWLKVEERLTASLLVFVRGIDVLKVPNCLFNQLAHSSDTHR
jgi:hypothetical protein